jgi:hypothetical protein
VISTLGVNQLICPNFSEISLTWLEKSKIKNAWMQPRPLCELFSFWKSTETRSSGPLTRNDEISYVRRIGNQVFWMLPRHPTNYFESRLKTVVSSVNSERRNQLFVQFWGMASQVYATRFEIQSRLRIERVAGSVNSEQQGQLFVQLNRLNL